MSVAKHPIFEGTDICGAVSFDGAKVCVLLEGHDGDHGWSREPEVESAFIWWCGAKVISDTKDRQFLDAQIGALRTAFFAGWHARQTFGEPSTPSDAGGVA